MKYLYLLAFASIVFVLAGCQILGPDDDDDSDSTYPAAMDLPAASFGQLFEGVHEEGQFNLTVFVIGISECPEGALCIIADNIQVAESPFTDGLPLIIDAKKPSQFSIDTQYVLSLDVNSLAPPSTQQYATLLGYSLTN